MSIENGYMPAMPVECYIGPAGVPVSGVMPTANTVFHMGLTKREMFAAMAMRGIVSNDENWLPDYAARRAIAFADALLTELAKKGGGE